MVKVKICGITNHDDAQLAVSSGADALGFVFYDPSPRSVSPEQARDIIRQLPPFIQTVGLFVNEALTAVNDIADACGLDIIQLHGEESPDYCAGVKRRVLKALRVRDETSLEPMAGYPDAMFLLDAWSPNARGGTGQTFNWDIAAQVAESHRIVLAGGLTTANIAAAISQVRPYAVDVSSGVESRPGIKDADKIREFIRTAKTTPF
ncbi:MAG: phosphoribosylanthranilate isomerase [Desulfuromonadales bacterium]|nr:phosphoribosylanthranilate isomerase [Desulfuromonadales bacterium]